MCKQSFSCILVLTRQSFFQYLYETLRKGERMPNRKRELNKDTPPKGYEMAIAEAWQGIANFYDAIEIAESGHRADFIQLNQTKVVIKAKYAGENPDAVVTVCPDCTAPDLKLVED